MKLPDHYYDYNCYWAHMLTLRCNGNCPFCILHGRGRYHDLEEISGDETLAFWNGLEHPKGHRLSLIGGEPTLHKDFEQILHGLENYAITLSTNCSSKFFENDDYVEKLVPHPSSTLRVNTTYHPQHMKADDYINVIKRLRESEYFVDKTAYVNYPGVEAFQDEIDKVAEHIHIRRSPYLGFSDKDHPVHAPACPNHIEPNESYPDNMPRVQCGITNMEAYRDAAGQYVGKEVICSRPMFSMIIGPNGKLYNCHYKLYYDIDPTCSIDNFTPIVFPVECKHYGFCNWCDIPAPGLECKKNKTARPQVLTKLYDKREIGRPEIKHLIGKISRFAEKHSLEYNTGKWFEYAYSLLYSGQRWGGKVLDVGSAKSVFPYYLASTHYDVTTADIADSAYRQKRGAEFGVKTLTLDLRKYDPQLENSFDLITCLSVIEHIDNDVDVVLNLARYLRPGGVLVISTDFYETYIEYPDANRTLVRDRPPERLVDSRVYTPEAFINRVVNPLKDFGLEQLGAMDLENVDITDPQERSARGLYTFGITCFRKKVGD